MAQGHHNLLLPHAWCGCSTCSRASLWTQQPTSDFLPCTDFWKDVATRVCSPLMGSPGREECSLRSPHQGLLSFGGVGRSRKTIRMVLKFSELTADPERVSAQPQSTIPSAPAGIAWLRLRSSVCSSLCKASEHSLLGGAIADVQSVP